MNESDKSAAVENRTTGVCYGTKYDGYSYDLTEIPEGIVQRTEENKFNKDLLKWSGKNPIPAIGMKVRINFNELGNGIVVSYFWEHGYFGIKVQLDNAPAWHKKQHKGTKHEGNALVFGMEINEPPTDSLASINH